MRSGGTADSVRWARSWRLIFWVPVSWPDKTGIDELLLVYAELSEVEDPRDIWDRALRMWREGSGLDE